MEQTGDEMKTLFKFTSNQLIILVLLFFSFGYWLYYLENVLRIGLWNVALITIIFMILVRVWISNMGIKE